MRVLVLGGQGMLGRSLVREARRRGWAALGPSRSQADLRDAATLLRVARGFRPAYVVNAAAFTRVDDCESERELAMEVNGRAVTHAAEAAREVGAKLIQISSDYVFDGRATSPYAESVPTGPLSVYGASKLLGEEKALELEGALVVRASWLFGPDGPNFVGAILRQLDRGVDSLQVVDDQVGAPTYTPYLARAICDLALAGAEGIVHYRNREAVSWHGFACEIAKIVAPQVTVLPVATEAFPRPAARPAYSVLDVRHFEALLGRPVESWSAGLVRLLQIWREGDRP